MGKKKKIKEIEFDVKAEEATALKVEKELDKKEADVVGNIEDSLSDTKFLSSEQQLETVREHLRKSKENATLLTSATSSARKGINTPHQAAGRLIAKFVSDKAKNEKASAFRQWACKNSAAQATGQQEVIASELSQQLETTREKLGILKSHLKKGRKGGNLNSIREGYETT